MTDLSPEKQRIARIIKKYIDKAIAEMGTGYNIEIEGKFEEPSIRLIIAIQNS